MVEVASFFQCAMETEGAHKCAILLSVQYQISHLGASHLRLFHVSDSFVAMAIVAKGRTASRQLGVVLKFLNSLLLGFGLTLAIGHVESTENPTDGASRQVAFLHQDYQG